MDAKVYSTDMASWDVAVDGVPQEVSRITVEIAKMKGFLIYFQSRNMAHNSLARSAKLFLIINSLSEWYSPPAGPRPSSTGIPSGATKFPSEAPPVPLAVTSIFSFAAIRLILSKVA